MTTDLFGTPPATLDSITTPKHRGRRAGTLGIVATAAIALFIGGMGATASAAPGATSSGSTTANAVVVAGITLTGLTSSVTLTGTPGATVQSAAPVTYNVETNNVAGYSVHVGTAATALVPLAPFVSATGDTIPIAALTIREADTGGYTALSTGTGALVHTQGGRSVDQGDPLSTNFQMRIPTVDAGTYTASLNYVAITL